MNQKQLKKIKDQDIEAGIRQDLMDRQEKLDNEIVICKKCGQKEKWVFIREYGDCGDCVEKYVKEARCTKCGDTIISKEDGLCCNCV